MPISDSDFQQLVQLVEDGELDDRMLELRDAIDERNARRKEAIRKLVKSVWGDQAEITVDAPEQQVNAPSRYVTPQRPRTDRAPIEYAPEAEPQIPQGVGDSMSAWPTPVESSGGGGGQGAPPYSPVSDPLAGGGSGDPYGDNDPNIVSTGAQIG